MSDQIQRFSFANLPIRGEIASLNETISTICEQHNYPNEIRQLLSEALVSVALLADIIKIEGRLSLQLQSPSLVKLLMVETNHQGQMRGVLHTNPEQVTPEKLKNYRFDDWTQGGQMAITIDPDKGQRYQGIVPLDNDSLAACLEDYFNRSEQLPTHIKLFANEQQTFGLFIQTLPEESASSIGNSNTEQAFEHVLALTNTIKPEEAFTLEHDDLLYRLFHQDEVSIYPAKQLSFKCSCSRERNLQALTTIPAKELLDLLEEQGSIEMICDFCSNKEIFARQDIMNLLTTKADQGAVH